jgi:hypothetical protein
MSVTFRRRLASNLKDVSKMMSDPFHLMDLLYSYSHSPGNKYRMTQVHVFESSDNRVNRLIDHAVAYPEPDAINFDVQKRLLHATAVRFIKIVKPHESAIQMIVDRTKKPTGMHRLNFPAYIMTYYYVSLIDALSLDHEGLLEVIKHLATCTCKLFGENFTDVMIDILTALDHNILTVSRRPLSDSL